ncbi:MAG: hypothetical protein AVDCRST_MAG73-1008 [uncultured Thermomicrobiales bacterium]|uniref:Uncharacterized protein n=1 Tax=uncultured Thermomicrobiales bacterium TaxID=1645740 RepID=A0A6J4TUV7_9BACT|nr:MAG: hypothetical protein AVDCRST_MAG73-1008 [uncultured Thermomicrobiales bacterium]
MGTLARSGRATKPAAEPGTYTDQGGSVCRPAWSPMWRLGA